MPLLEPWSLACDHIIVPDFSGATGALAKVELGRAALDDHDAVGAMLSQLRESLATLLHHGVRHSPRSWPAEAIALATKLGNGSLHALEQRVRDFAHRVISASRAASEENLASPFLELAALLQLHEDARAFDAQPDDASPRLE